MTRISVAIALSALLLNGCLSISTSETPVPVAVNACQGREQLCQEICGSAGVQSYTCNAQQTTGFEFRCVCRSKATAL